jgi:hypothetical protein
MISRHSLAVASLFSAVLACPAVAQKPEGDLAKVLPADTLGIFAVHDLAAVFAIDAEGAVRKLLAHPAAKELLDEGYESFDWLENQEIMTALDLEPKELVRMLNGRLLVALPSLELVKGDVQQSGTTAQAELDLEPNGGFALLLDLDVTQDRFEELLHNIEKLWSEQPEMNKVTLVGEDFEGVKVWQYELDFKSGKTETPVRFAFRDGLLVASNEKETVEDLLDRVKNGAPENDRLADDAAYIETLERVGNNDMLVHFNVKEFMPLVNQLIEHQIAEMGDEATEYVNGPDLVAALGLDAFHSFFVGIDVENDELSAAVGYTQESRQRGLAELMAYDDRGIELPSYFHSGLHSGSVSSIDFTKLYRLVMDMVQKASPFAHRFLRSQIENIQKYSFPLETALLENTDGFLAEVVGYPEGFTPGPEDHPSQAYVLRVKDGEALATALGEYADMNADEDPAEYMNEFIYKMPLPIPMAGVGGASPEVAFAVVENYAIIGIGDARMVESVIGNLKNPGEKLTDDDRLMTAFDDLPNENVVGLSWMNVADVLTNAIRGVRDMLELSIQTGGPGGNDRAAREFAKKSMDELPDVSDLDYFIVSKTYRTPETFVSRFLLRRGKN